MAELKSTKAFGSFKVDGKLYDSFGNSGTSGQVLKSTGTGIQWGDAPTLGSGIFYVAGTSNSNPGTSSFTLSGLQAGDFVLYFGAEDIANVNTPTGEVWTAVPGLGTQPDNDSAPDSAVFYTFASGTSVTASGLATGNEEVHVMIAFRNVNPTNPFDVNAGQITGFALPNPPQITPVTDNSMIVAAGFLDDDNIANVINPPAGYTTAVNMDAAGGALSSGSTGSTIMTAYKLLATAAAENPDSFGATGSFSDANKGISIALRPRATAVTAYLLANGGGTNARIENTDTTATGVDDNWLNPTWLSTSQTTDNISGFDQPTTTQITVPATGIYIVNVNLEINTGGAGTNDRLSAEVVLLVNSTREAYRAANSYLRSTGGHEETSSNHSTILSLTAGDTVAIQWRPTCTGRNNANADSVMDNSQSFIELIRIA